jgi:glycosyltransferase involved in cell wall biosynthesis
MTIEPETASQDAAVSIRRTPSEPAPRIALSISYNFSFNIEQISYFIVLSIPSAIYSESTTMSISLIATVLNEGATIHHVLDSIAAQTRTPDEIIIVDGGSTDNTRQIIESYPLPITLLHEPGCNISEGRNIAIRHAIGDIIAVTDAGVRIPPEWLENLVKPFNETAAGFFLPDPDPHSPFQVAMSATVLPQVEEIDPATFLPSSRSVAFSKTAWEAVGGYPEWLDYCEDLIFDLRLKDRYGSFPFAPEAVVYFKPRTSLRSFYRQYYLYARGDGKANLWRKRHIIRYATYLFVVPLVAFLAIRVHPLFLLGYLVGGVVYMRQPYHRLPRLWEELPAGGKLRAAGWVVIIRVVGDIAKMIGYPVGWRWRIRNHPPDWRQR